MAERLTLVPNSEAGLELVLANGVNWQILAHGSRANDLLRTAARIARLSQSARTGECLLLLREPESVAEVDDPEPKGMLEVAANGIPDVARAFGLIATRSPQTLLVHGALVARDGIGVLLAGPGGRGKTTSAMRLPSPWEVLSDDAALVLPDRVGNYVAHPWPTWSRVLWEGSAETWDVQRSVLLRQIFFLSWADGDLVEPVGTAQALCLVLESIEQLRGHLPRTLRSSATLRLAGFENASRLVKSVSVSILHISPEGPFWLAIEDALGMDPSQP